METQSFQEFFAALGSFTPARLHMRLAGYEHDYKPDKGMPPNSRAEAIYVHENIHYLQTCMTGYGQTVWNMYRQAIIEVINMWKKAVSSNKKKQIPLAYFSQCGLKEAVFANFIHSIFHECTELDRLRDMTRYNNISDAGLKLCNQKWRVNPEISLDSRKYILQGRDIIESHAKHLESIYSHVVNEVPINETLNLEKLPEEYWFVYLWFIQEVGKERAFEFPIICDLALQTIRCDPPKSEKEWRNSHPAWRFLKLTEAIKENVVPKLGSIGNAMEKYNEYVDQVLSHCGFKSLNEVFDGALSWYNGRKELLGLQTRMRDPLLFRMNIPWCGANPFLDIHIWIEIKNKFYSPLIQVGQTLSITPYEAILPPIDSVEMERIFIEYVGELHLQALSLQILGISSPYSIDPEEIQCGYGYFGIKKGCAYQTLCNCPGRFIPKEGLPVPIKNMSEDKIQGCDFGLLLMAYNIDVKELDVNFRIRHIPDLEELEKVAKGNIADGEKRI